MGLNASIGALEARLKTLDRATGHVHWAVLEGQPDVEQGHELADRYEAATLDLRAKIQQAQQAARTSRRATQGRVDLTAVCQALAKCQHDYQQISESYYGGLISIDWLDELRDLGPEAGDDWLIWAQGVEDALWRCPDLIRDVGAALIDCWQDVADWAGILPVAVQAINISPRVPMAEPATSNSPPT